MNATNEVGVVGWAESHSCDPWGGVDVYYPERDTQDRLCITHSFARRINRATIGAEVSGRTADGKTITVRIRDRRF